MADSAASPQSRPSRAASAKRRANPASTDTENKLARAARSAQRLAQLSDVARDDNTLDLFPDDPTRATLEAMNIDLRQRTLHGFELPEAVLAAVGALDSGAGSAPVETKAARRAPRAAKNEAAGPPRSAPLKASAREGGSGALADVTAAADASAGVAAMAMGLVAEDRATASLAAGVLLQEGAASSSVSAASVVQPAILPADISSTAAVSPPPAAKPAAPALEPFVDAAAPSTVHAGVASSSETTTADIATPAAATPPELDRARATAFADTVDALYGVIADQRRAATDHSRRMKWMLSIVVGALLATVAIGIAQTVLLMRLTRESTAQQHRLEQMMQNQQAAMASLIDARLATANARAAAPASAAPTSTVARQSQAPQPDAPSNRRGVRTQHLHKAKAANAR